MSKVINKILSHAKYMVCLISILYQFCGLILFHSKHIEPVHFFKEKKRRKQKKQQQQHIIGENLVTLHASRLTLRSTIHRIRTILYITRATMDILK